MNKITGNQETCNEFVLKQGLDIYNKVGFSSDKGQYNGGKEEPK